MATVSLNVVSVNNQNVTSYEQIFDTTLMRGLRTNQNLNNSITFTEAGDGSNQMSAWSISGSIYENMVLYWAFTFSGKTRYVKLYSNSSRTNLVAEGSAVIDDGTSGTVFLRTKNDNNIYGYVTVTIAGGGGTEDTDASNTITITNVNAYNDLQVNGYTEFVYPDYDERVIKYTVTETIDQVLALADGFEVYSGEAVGVIDATVGIAIGTYNIERADGLGTIDLPVGAVITRAYYRVNTTFTSATDAATIAISIPTDDVAGIVAATAISAGGNVWDAGNHEAIQTGTAANFSEITTDARTLTYTVAVEALTAGKLHLVIEYNVVA